MRRLIAALCVAVLLSVGLPAHATAASVAQTWPVGIEPFGVTIDPRDGKVYVAISDHNNWYGTEYMWAIDPGRPLSVGPARDTYTALPAAPGTGDERARSRPRSPLRFDRRWSGDR